MRTRHVIGIGAVVMAVIATLMAGDAPAFVEDLDGPACHAHIELGAYQAVGHGVEERIDFDMVVRADLGDVAVGEREEGLMTQPAQDVGLGEAYPCLDLGLILRTTRLGREDADAVMGGIMP